MIVSSVHRRMILSGMALNGVLRSFPLGPKLRSLVNSESTVIASFLLDISEISAQLALIS